VHRYRVFISYSHKDIEIVEKIVEILKGNDLDVLWDKDFAMGMGFNTQIKNFISSAHVFVPVLTKDSSIKGWVHQEIGYATALNVPVLPIMLDEVPGEMLSQLLAVQWTDDVEVMKKRLSNETFGNLVNHTKRNSTPFYECAEHHEERTMMLVKYASEITDLNKWGHFRQIAALGSFHIPPKPINNEAWDKRDLEFKASAFTKKWLLYERQIMEEHARIAGCSIIINPTLKSKYPESKKAKIQELVDFLKSMPDEKVNVAIDKKLEERNLTIVGDWFAAESVSVSLEGSNHSIFTRHAPTVRNKIDLFEQQFNNLNEDFDGDSTRLMAIETLEDILEK
jgi:hypothetical protein